MFSQMTKNNLQLSNQSCQELLRDSIDKMKCCSQKLMIFEVLTSKKSLFCEMSQQASTLSKKALGVDVNALVAHPNSNLRAFSYILIQALSQTNIGTQTRKQVQDKLKKFKQNPPKMKNYLLQQKFKPQESLQMFCTMQYKIMELLQSGLSLHQILKVYSGYLQLASIFLRCLLSMVKLINAQDCSQKLPTNQIFSILSQYLDLSYIVNKNIYLFPDLKVFIGAIYDKQFIFGRYYENNQQLKNNQAQIRQSTMQYMNQQNQNQTCKQMKISNMNLNVTMSEFMYSQRADIIPFSNKAPTPQFGQRQFMGFQEIMINSFGEQNDKKERPRKQSIEKQTTPQSNLQFDLLSNGADIQKQRQLMKESAFVKKGHEFDDPQIMTPASNNYQTNKNGFGSAFYLHQFDFFRSSNSNQGLTMEQMRSERVLMKGSSMVQHGQLFLQQVGQLKKEIQNQMIGRQRDRLTVNNTTLQQSVSARNLGNSFERNNKQIYPFIQSPKSQLTYDNKSKSSNSNISQKNQKKMELSSQVYQIRIENQVKPKEKKVKSPILKNCSRSNSQNKPSYSPKQFPKYTQKFNSPSPMMPPSNIKLTKPKLIQKTIPSKKLSINPRQSQFAQKTIFSHSDSFQNNNHSHIHIHIHNENKSKSRSKSKSQNKNSMKIESPKSKQVNIQYNCNIKDKNQLKSAFENVIPEIIRHIQSQKMCTNYNSKQKERQKQKDAKILNQSTSDYPKYHIYSNHPSNYKMQPDHLKSKSDKVIYPYLKYSPVESLNYNSTTQERQQQQQFRLKKRKSQNGLQIINQQKIKYEKSESFAAPYKKQPFHIPSFLRKKQKILVQPHHTVPSFAKYIQKSHNEQYLPNNFDSQAYISTQTSIKQKQKPQIQQNKKKLQKQINIARGKMTLNDDISQSFGTYQQIAKQKIKR